MNEASLVERISAAADAVRQVVTMVPKVALSLSGSSDAGRYFARHAAVELDPLLGPAGGGGTHGELIFGELGGIPTVLLNGRPGEGASAREATLPVRLARKLGAGVLIATGRAEAVNPQWQKARLMLISDHINLLGANPLVGPNYDELGPRFPDMTDAYDLNLGIIAGESARERGIQLVRGVYIGRAGGSASGQEAELLRTFGGDAVGAGVVSEVIVGVHAGMRVVGLVALEPPRTAGAQSPPARPGVGSSGLEIIAGVIQRI